MVPVGIGILGLVFLGGLFVLLGVGVALLFRRGTWPIGLVLIGFPAVMVLLGIGLFSARTVTYHSEAVPPPPPVVRLSTESRAAEIRREQEANAEALRQRLQRDRIRIEEKAEETREQIAKSAPKPPAPPKTVEIVIDDKSKRPPKPEKVAIETTAEKAVPENAEAPATKELPDEKTETPGIPVNSVTTFGLIVRALANAIDSELPRNMSGDEALVALEETVNEELPAGTSRSGLIAMLGKVIGKAVAEKHEQISGGGAPEEEQPLPEWISQPSGKVDGVYQTVLEIGPFTTDLECEKALVTGLETAVNDYVGLYMGREVQAAGVGLPPERLEELLVVKKFQRRAQTKSFGRMVQLYALVEFDSRANEMLREEWKTAQIQERLILSGLSFGGVFLLIASAYGTLRLDLVTGGKARGRIALTVIAIAVLLGILVPRLLSDLNQRTALDETSELLTVSTVSETATATGGSAPVVVAPVSWAVVALSLLFVIGVVFSFRARTRKLGFAFLILCAILFGAGLLFVA